MDGRQNKRHRASKVLIRSSQPSHGRASVGVAEETVHPQHTSEKMNSKRKLARFHETRPPLRSSSPEAESSKSVSSSHSPTTNIIKHAESPRKPSKKRKAPNAAGGVSSKVASKAASKEDQATSPTTSNSKENDKIETLAHIIALQLENARLQREVESKDIVLEKQRETISSIYTQCTCTVCMELIWRPHVLSPCGHIFCARCLVAWFTKPAATEMVLPRSNSPDVREIQRGRNLRRQKVCPHCREKVVVAPVEVWLVKGLVDQIDKSMREGQGNDDHLVQGQESLAGLSTEAIEEATGSNLPSSKAIWKDIFAEDRRDGPIFDEEDAIYRCSFCMNELLRGVCTNTTCGMLYDMEGMSGSEDDILDDDYSLEEDEYGEYEGDEDDLGFIDDAPIVVLDSEDEDGSYGSDEDGHDSHSEDFRPLNHVYSRSYPRLPHDVDDDDDDDDSDSVREVSNPNEDNLSESEITLDGGQTPISIEGVSEEEQYSDQDEVDFEY